MELDLARLLGILNRHRVAYVLIGGLAAVYHGSPFVTEDADITPQTDRANLEKLAAALVELGTRIRTARLAAGLQSARPRNNGGATTDGFETPVPDARRQQASSMLSRFQAAQRDGRAAAAEAPTEPPEEQEPS